MKLKRIRLYINQNNGIKTKKDINLKINQLHYLKNVMRCKNGDIITIFDGETGEWSAELNLTPNDNAWLTPIAKQKNQTDEENLDLWLLFCLIKKSRSDFIIEKAVELGVSNIFPVLSSRSQVKDFNISRARSIAIEAAEQCGRLTIPQISDVNSLKNVLQGWPKDRNLVWGDIDNEISDLSLLNNSGALLVGPEGGFSNEDKEILNFYQMCKPIKLGNRVLRSETAAISLLSIWSYINKKI